MPSRRSPLTWLVLKEWRGLLAARSYWIMLLAIGPLVGVTFASAVRTYAEASGLGGTAAGVGEAFSPLVGIWAPTFSACELAAAFLLPFVAIRVVSGDLQSGALKIELQHPLAAAWRIAAKAAVLMAGWVVATSAPIVAVVLWRSYGGTLYAPELLAVLYGHAINAALTIALAAAAAVLTEHPSTAAIVTLSVTIGTWVLNFIAAVQGGWWERLAGYTPTAVVAQFQHGLVRLDVALITASLVLGGLGLAAIWLRIGESIRRRTMDTVLLAAIVVATITAAAFLRPSWDLSENRMNSFSEADESALKAIRTPLRIEAHLAPEDPRRTDLERQALSKLRRLLPSLDVQYISSTGIGLFEQTNEHYGEIWYILGDRKTMSRMTTAEGVLETIYGLAGVSPPAEDDEHEFRGHPLAAPPRGASAVFFVLWPSVVLVAWRVVRRQLGLTR